MPPNSFSDSELISMFRQEDRRNEAMEFLYLDSLTALMNLVGHKRENALDLASEAMLILVKKFKDPDFVIQKSVKDYFLGIARMLWRNKNSSTPAPAPENIQNHLADTHATADDTLDQHHKVTLLLKAIDMLSKKCRELIKLYFWEKASGGKPPPWKKVAEMMNYASPNAAKMAGSRCREKLREIYESFVD